MSAFYSTNLFLFSRHHIKSIPESLKNMLLVMSTAGIFDEEECTLTAGSQLEMSGSSKGKFEG